MLTVKPIKLELCRYCRGTQLDPSTQDPLACPACCGGGYEPVAGDLGPTRTYKTRSFVYNPGTGDLRVERGKTSTNYRVREFIPDQTKGEHVVRAFAVTNLDKHEVYHISLGAPRWHKCSCTGFLAESVENGNRRAWKKGGEMYVSAGCIHLDVLLALWWGGVLDARSLNKEIVHANA